jgi:hypothetical protein
MGQYIDETLELLCHIQLKIYENDIFLFDDNRVDE